MHLQTDGDEGSAPSPQGKATGSGRAKWRPPAMMAGPQPDLPDGPLLSPPTPQELAPGRGGTPTPQASLADALRILPDLSDLSAASRSAYAYALQRVPEFLGRSPEDIPFDPEALERHLPRAGFVPGIFKTEAAYKGFRRKALAGARAAAKALFGTTAPEAAPDDRWRDLLSQVDLIAEASDLSPLQLLPLRLLAKEARPQGVEPGDVTAAWFGDLRAHLGTLEEKGRNASLGRLPRLLGMLADASPGCASLLAAITAPDPDKNHAPDIPAPLLAEVDDAVAAHCAGVWDEISQSWDHARAEATAATYTAVLRAYLVVLAEQGLLPEGGTLTDCLAMPLLLQATRHWALRVTMSAEGQKTPGQRPFSATSLYSYLRILGQFARQHGIDSSAADKWRGSNRTLTAGAKARKTMDPKARAFCIWLLSTREAQLRFQSLHITLYRLCLPLLEKERREALGRREADRLRQTDMLAAMAAIQIWGAPLRIGNLLHLTISGPAPWLILPDPGRARDGDGTPANEARINIPAEATKNKRPIDQVIRPDRSQALAILLWYIREIRPRLPGAGEVPWLFPGHAGPEQPIRGSTVRPHLAQFCRETGFYPMRPHWFRHGTASLFLRDNPGAFAHIARRLDDTPATVRAFYAFIDEEAIRGEVQDSLLRMAGLAEDSPPAKSVPRPGPSRGKR